VSRTDVLDRSHRADLVSWVDSAHGHAQFPIQNLPMGVFDHPQGPRVGVAIGDRILDLKAAADCGLLRQLAPATTLAVTTASLNAWMALPAEDRQALRLALSDLLEADSRMGREAARRAGEILRGQFASAMLLPAAIGDYTDFYAGIHHAYNCGVIFRPEQPLQPNYKHIPVAYHGRASTVRASGTPVRRPGGQYRVGAAAAPTFQPTARLDYEMELAMWIGPGNTLGQPIGIEEAGGHVVGYGLLNDWSARDIQAWESAPLGPFQGKNFMTSVSPWVVTGEAMAPFRAPRMARDAETDPPVPAYLDNPQDARAGAVSIEVEVALSTRRMRERGEAPHVLSRADTGALLWTPAQMVAHHTAGGCDLRPGDLFGSGTISMPEGRDCGCLLEMTHGGKVPVRLPDGDVRAFLEDGDEVVMRGTCRREGFVSIGFGECRGVVQG